MGRGDNWDPGYFPPENEGGQQGSNPTATVKFRKPGLDWGTFVWPIAMGLVHMITSTIVLLVFTGVDIAINGAEIRAMYGVNDVFSANNPEVLAEVLYRFFPAKAIIYSLLQIIIFAAFLAWRNRKEKYYVLTGPGKPLDWLSSILMICTGLAFANLWMTLLMKLGEKNDVIQKLFQGYSDMTETAFVMEGNPILLTLGLAVFVPIAEELLFRGIIMAELRRVMPLGWAVVINALIFAIFHMNFVQGVYVFVVGVLIALAYVWSKSLWVPILMHMLYNFFGSVFFQIVPLDEAGENIFGIVLTVLGVIGLVMLFILRKKRKQEPAPKPTPPELLNQEFNRPESMA